MKMIPIAHILLPSDPTRCSDVQDFNRSIYEEKLRSVPQTSEAAQMGYDHAMRDAVGGSDLKAKYAYGSLHLHEYMALENEIYGRRGYLTQPDQIVLTFKSNM